MGGIGFGVCVQGQKDCFAYVSGKCRVLDNGEFRDRKCPFYKPLEVINAQEFIKKEKKDG